MTVRYTIEIIHGSKFVEAADRARAEATIDAALDLEGITTDDQFKAALKAFAARCEGEPHDAALADAYDRIQSAADAALTDGWNDPNGAGLSIGAHF